VLQVWKYPILKWSGLCSCVTTFVIYSCINWKVYEGSAVFSGRLNVFKGLKRTNKIVRTEESQHMIGLENTLVDIYLGRHESKVRSHQSLGAQKWYCEFCGVGGMWLDYLLAAPDDISGNAVKVPHSRNGLPRIVMQVFQSSGNHPIPTVLFIKRCFLTTTPLVKHHPPVLRRS
jgi:hypothetical protein